IISEYTRCEETVSESRCGARDRPESALVKASVRLSKEVPARVSTRNPGHVDEEYERARTRSQRQACEDS
ncbi:hypothetical protein DENSPDRAFT_837079, partial [Dentipellis sp. KUC8613]